MSKREGFWHSPREPAYPIPEAKARPFEGQADFLTALYDIEDRANVIHYRGWSTCRVCGKQNGSAEFEYRGWRWPSGYRHYVADHNVRPSPEFREFISISVNKR